MGPVRGIPEDPDLPEVRVLLSSDVRPILATVVDEDVTSFRIDQISYRPGRRIVVLFPVRTAGGRDVPVVLAAGRIPQGAALLDDGTHRVGAWVFPRDPALPGLPVLFDRERRSRLLEPLGVPPDTEVRARSYRPGKRAVVEVTAPGARLFVKSIRPADVGRLQDLHVRLAARVPIPRSLGWSPETGLVVLQAITGAPLSTAPAPGPDPRRVLALLDRLPGLDDVVSSRRSRVGSHVRLLRRIAPHRSGDLARIEDEASRIREDRAVPVHGDLHSGQLIVDRGALVGVVDVDTAGMGERADDLANLLAHLHVVALGDPSGEAARYGERFHAVARTHHEPADLARRVAASLLGYGSGPWSRRTPGWPSAVDALIDASLRWLPAA